MSTPAFATPTVPVNHVTRSFTEIAATVRDAGLMKRSYVFYSCFFAALVLALGGVITGMVLLGDSWFQLLMAAALGVVLTQFAFLGHEASHRTVFRSGKANDNLIALAAQVAGTRNGREMDMLLTTGERVSAALLTMALHDLGVDAVSFTGSQVGIITDTVHGKAKILEVKGDRVRQALAQGKVAVVAGFQGVSTDKEVTTMGRGASDLTASALASALDADACERLASPRCEQARRVRQLFRHVEQEQRATIDTQIARIAEDFAQPFDVRRVIGLVVALLH